MNYITSYRKSQALFKETIENFRISTLVWKNYGKLTACHHQVASCYLTTTTWCRFDLVNSANKVFIIQEYPMLYYFNLDFVLKLKQSYVKSKDS